MTKTAPKLAKTAPKLAKIAPKLAKVYTCNFYNKEFKHYSSKINMKNIGVRIKKIMII